MLCVQDAGCEGVAILLLGNKTDCEEARQVPPEAGQQLAQVSLDLFPSWGTPLLGGGGWFSLAWALSLTRQSAGWPGPHGFLAQPPYPLHAGPPAEADRQAAGFQEPDL